MEEERNSFLSKLEQNQYETFGKGLLPAKLLGERSKKGVLAAARLLKEPVVNLTDLKLGDRMMWEPFFKSIGRFPFDAQQSAIAAILGKEGLDLPNSGELTNFLTQINSTEWLLPLEEPDHQLLQEQVDNHLSALKLHSQPVVILRDWQDARDLSRKRDRDPEGGRYPKHLHDREKYKTSNSWGLKIQRAALDVYCESSDVFGDYSNQILYTHLLSSPKETDRLKRGADTRELGGTIYDVPWGPTYDGYGGFQDDLRQAVSCAGLWITLKEQMENRDYNQDNPFLPLVELYKKGLWPIGSLSEQFLILIPPNPDPKWNLDFVPDHSNFSF